MLPGAGTPAEACRTQAALLLSTRPGKLREAPSPLVGASCLLYLAPGAVLLRSATAAGRLSQSASTLWTLRVQSAAWAAQAGLSFQADHVHLREDSYWHVADRVWAVGLCLQQLGALTGAALRGIRAPVVGFTVLASGGLVCLQTGRTAESYREWELSHSAWHLLSVSAVVLGLRRFPR